MKTPTTKTPKATEVPEWLAKLVAHVGVPK